MKKFVFIVLFCFSTYVLAMTPAEQLQNKLNAIHTMSAHFSQKVTVKKKTVSKSSGSMALKRPGTFRWETKDPMEQLIVADGKKMWIYDVELEQVSVKTQQKGLGGTAALFLSGYDEDATQDFLVTEQNNGSSSTFNLKTKTDKENFQRIQLIFTNDQLTALELYDQLGQVTYVTFSNIKMNQNVSANLFQFKPPKGVDVIKQ